MVKAVAHLFGLLAVINGKAGCSHVWVLYLCDMGKSVAYFLGLLPLCHGTVGCLAD